MVMIQWLRRLTRDFLVGGFAGLLGDWTVYCLAGWRFYGLCIEVRRSLGECGTGFWMRRMEASGEIERTVYDSMLLHSCAC